MEPNSFSGSYHVYTVNGITGTYPCRTFNINGIFIGNSSEYTYSDVIRGDIFYDVIGKRYQILGFDPEDGLILKRGLKILEIPIEIFGSTGINGDTGLPETGRGLIMKPDAKEDDILNRLKFKAQGYNTFHNTLISTKNCKIDEGVQNSAIISAKNKKNDVQYCLMTNEICSNRFTIISDSKMKKNIVECPDVDAASLFSKIKKIKTYQYKFLEDDENAPMRTGFIAQNVTEEFPDLVLKNYRFEKNIYKKTDNNWYDYDDNLINTGDIEPNPHNPSIGIKYETTNRSTMSIDGVAFLEKIWVTLQKLIIENENLKARITALE